MKFLALLVLSAALLTSACGSNAAPGGEKVFRYGTPAYGIANENAGMDPHEAYQGWSAIRYGVGETLFKFDDAMQPQRFLNLTMPCSLSRGWPKSTNLLTITQLKLP